MRIYKPEMDTLRRALNRKSFTFDDFAMKVEDGKMCVDAFCKEMTMAFSLKQKLALPNTVVEEFCLPTEEWTKSFTIFTGNAEFVVEKVDDEIKLSTVDGKKSLKFREVTHTTAMPKFKIDKEAADAIQVEPNEMKRVMQSMGSLGSKELTLSTKGNTLTAFAMNDVRSTLDIETGAQVTAKSGGNEVKFGSLIADFVEIFNPMTKVEMLIMERQPLVAIQKNDDFELEMILVPSIV